MLGPEPDWSVWGERCSTPTPEDNVDSSDNGDASLEANVAITVEDLTAADSDDNDDNDGPADDDNDDSDDSTASMPGPQETPAEIATALRRLSISLRQRSGTVLEVPAPAAKARARTASVYQDIAIPQQPYNHYGLSCIGMLNPFNLLATP